MAREQWIIAPGQGRIIDVDDVHRLKVSLNRGHIDVIGHDEPGARIEIDGVTGKDLSVTLEDGQLTIDHPQLGWENFVSVFRGFRGTASASVSILVPHHVALTFGVVSAEGLVSGVYGTASVSTVSSAIVVDRCRGDLQVNAVSGELVVRAHEGRVTAHTVSGEVTVSGTIDQLTCDSVSGDMVADLQGSPAAVRANSVSGDVLVRVPADTPVNYRLNSVSGRVQLGENEFRGVKGGFSGSWPAATSGAARTLNLKVNTVSGRITALHGAGTSAPAEAVR